MVLRLDTYWPRYLWQGPDPQKSNQMLEIFTTYNCYTYCGIIDNFAEQDNLFNVLESL